MISHTAGACGSSEAIILRAKVSSLTAENAKLLAEIERKDDLIAELRLQLNSALAEIERLEPYRPCEVCRQPGANHNDCTGDCASLCCALDSCEATVAQLRAEIERERGFFKLEEAGRLSLGEAWKKMREQRDAALAEIERARDSEEGAMTWVGLLKEANSNGNFAYAELRAEIEATKNHLTQANQRNLELRLEISEHVLRADSLRAEFNRLHEEMEPECYHTGNFITDSEFQDWCDDCGERFRRSLSSETPQ
jgi:hypothetical protein